MTKFLLLYLPNAFNLLIVQINSSYCSSENVSLAPSMNSTTTLPFTSSSRLGTLVYYVSLADLNI
jgi:hypothetical protein